MKHICTEICQTCLQRCTKCNECKYFCEFHKDKKVKSGHVSQCKTCVSQRLKIHYQGNKEKILDRVKQYTEDNKEQIKEYQKYWHNTNRDKKIKHNKKYRNNHREQISQQKRQYFEQNKEYILARNKKWRQANPDKVRLYVNERRVRWASAEGSFTEQEWLAVCENQDYKCFDCGVEGKLTIGHIVPLIRGGSNYISNIIAQCKPCNSKQGIKIHDRLGN